MKAYHNDQMLKDLMLLSLQDHYDADEIVKGQYWEGGKGCAVGCTIYSDQHKDYETLLGIPEWLAHLEDAIFEGLPNGKAKHWPIRFMSAIKTGVDLERVKIPFLIFVVESTLDKFDHKEFPDCKKAIDSVLVELRRDVIDKDQIKAAARAARAAAMAAVRSACAASAAEAAAEASTWAEMAVRAAVRAAAWAAVKAAAGDASAASDTASAAAWEKFADKLIELIESAGSRS